MLRMSVFWLLSYAAVFPKLNPKPKYSYTVAKDIFVAIQNDVRLPRENVTLDLLQSEMLTQCRTTLSFLRATQKC